MSDANLARYGSQAKNSRGRLLPEQASQTRTVFQRDRDRIVHSTAFRRLEHKTQVFVHHEGDHYRSLLTHTLEVDQIALGKTFLNFLKIESISIAETFAKQ